MWKVDLLGVDLVGVDFMRVDLVGVDFMRVDLVGLTPVNNISKGPHACNAALLSAQKS